MVATALTIHSAVRTRRLISAMLLLLQALGLQHLALSSHAFDDDGLAFEHTALATDSHAEDSHVCADAEPRDESVEACPVVASWLTASHLSPGRTAVRASPERNALVAHPRPARAPVPLLSLAPKSSPPAS